jgi:threonylcarbamoyladenosine tRNA methylthiotransferase MtaB
MKRRYKKELYEQRVQKIKDLLPHACIGVDVIVGFPNETDEDFQETYQFLHELPISYLHVFSYSSRENTLAAKMDNQVSNEIKNLRSKILRNLSEKKKHQFATDFLNLEKEILLENKIQNGMRMGHTDNYLKVWIPLDESEGFIKVKLAQHIGSDEFLGEVIHNGNIMENKLLNFI